MKIIEAKQVTKTYTIDHREIRVLDDVSLSVSESEFLVVEGNSGSGKTTAPLGVGALPPLEQSP